MDTATGKMAIFRNYKLDLKELLSFFAPVVFEQFCISLCNLIISASIAKLGSAQVSSFNLVDMLNIFLLQIFIAMGTGAAVVVAQHRGKNDPVGAGRVAVQSLWFLTGVSVITTALVMIFHNPILNAVLGQAERDVYENGRLFLMTSALSVPFFMLYYGSANIVRGSGAPKRTMILSILTNALYALFSWLFIQLGLGMLSPGLALILARAYGALHGLILVKRGNENLFVRSLWIRKLEFQVVKLILFIGVPMSLENNIFQGGRLLTQNFIIPFGTASIAANGIANNMSGLLLVPGNALALSMVPVVGRFIGMGDEARARSVTRAGLAVATAMHALTAAACFILMTPYIGLYNQPEEVNAIIRSLMREYTIYMPVIWATAFVLPAALRAAGDVKYNMAASVASMVVMRVALSFVFTRLTPLGVRGIWYGMYADWIVRGVLYVIRFRGQAWTKKKLV